MDTDFVGDEGVFVVKDVVDILIGSIGDVIGGSVDEDMITTSSGMVFVVKIGSEEKGKTKVVY